MAFKPVTDVFTEENTSISSVYTMAIGPEITYYKIPAYNSGFTMSSLSHLWSNINVRTEADYNIINQPYSSGGFLGSALEKIPEAFWTTGAVGFSIKNDNYRVQIYGQNIGMQIPINSTYPGATSGLTATTVYGSFVYNVDNLNKNPNSLCSAANIDSFISEPNKAWTSDQGIGFAYLQGTNPNTAAPYKFFDSGVVYLMSDVIYNTFSGATGSSSSWGYQFGQTNKYSKGARQISTDPSNTQYTGVGGYDRIVGAVFLNFGFGMIWDPQLVSAFDWSRVIGGDETTISGATFTSGDTAFVSQDYDISESLKVNIVAGQNEWVSSTNSSYIGTGQDCGIAISTVGLYDATGGLLAIVKPSEAIIKTPGNFLILNLELPVSANIQTSLADTRGRIDTGSGIAT